MSTHLWVFKWCKCVADICFLSKVVETHVTNLWPFFRAGFRIMEIKWKIISSASFKIGFQTADLAQIVYSDRWSLHTNHINTCKGLACPVFCFFCFVFFSANIFWMQTSLFISLFFFINRTFHRQTDYTFKYRNMSLVANHSNNQSQLITEWKKRQRNRGTPSQSQCYPVSGMVTSSSTANEVS